MVSKNRCVNKDTNCNCNKITCNNLWNATSDEKNEDT